MATAAEKAKLEAIRNDMAMVGPDWSIEADGNGMVLIVRDPADGEPRAVARFLDDIPFVFQNFLMRSGDSQQLLLALLDRCAAAYNEAARKLGDQKKYSAEAAIKCRNDQAFRQFLIERTDLRDAADAERIKTHLRFILNIGSLGDLDVDADAAARWNKLRRDFNDWRRHG